MSTSRKTCIDGSEQVVIKIVTAAEAASEEDGTYVLSTSRGCQSECANAQEEPELFELTISEAASIADEALVDITSAPSETILFDDQFVGSAALIDGHLSDIPTDTSWLNLSGTQGERIELDGSGNARNDVDEFGEFSTDAIANVVDDGTSTQQIFTHTGSVELRVDVVVPSINIDPRTSVEIQWLQWTDGLFTVKGSSTFQIQGSSKIIMGYSRYGEDPDENTQIDNDIDVVNISVTPDVGIRLGWTISADMQDIEMWWALLSDLSTKHVVGSSAGIHGPYTPNAGNIQLIIHSAAGDSGTTIWQQAIDRIMIVQY